MTVPPNTEFLICISALLFAIGAWLAWKATRNLISSVFLSVGIFGLFSIGGWIYVEQQSHILTLFTVALATFFFGMGALITAGIFKFRPRSELEACKKKTGHSSAQVDSAYYLSVLILAGLAFLFLVWFFARVGAIILSSNSPAARATAAQGSGVQFRAVFVFLPVSLLTVYSLRKNSKWRAGKILLAFLAVMSFAAVILMGSRGYAAIYIISGIILLGYSPWRVNKKVLALVIALFILLATAIQYTYPEYQHFTPWLAVKNVLYRMTRSQAEGLDYIIYRLVPDQGFYYGGVLAWDFSGFLSTLRLIPHTESFSSWTWQHLTDFQYPDQKFTLSTTTIGDLYADFGLAGVASGMTAYGGLAQLLYMLTLRMRKHWFWMAILAYAQYMLISAHISGSILGVLVINGLSLVFYIVVTLIIVGVASHIKPEPRSSSATMAKVRAAK